MYRPNNPRFTRPPMAHRGHAYGPQPRHWTPDHVREDAPKVHSKAPKQSDPTQAPKALKPAIKPYGPEINRWRSSFNETEENDNSSEKQNSPDRMRFSLYGPYHPVKSNSEDKPPPEDILEPPKSRGRWDIDDNKKRRPSSEAAPLLHNQRPEPVISERGFTNRQPEPGPSERGRFPFQQPDSVSSNRGFTNPPPEPGPSERRSFSSAQPTDTVYRTQATTVPAAVQFPPPAPLHSYKPTTSSGMDKAQTPPRKEVQQDPGRSDPMPPKAMVCCDLCEVELSNATELEEHLESKIHWDTLEHIQTHNEYDDMTVAFLQDLMHFKSQKSSRAIEATALPALQEYDHMTKVEMFHCAACNTLVPTSAAAVQEHITSQQHMTKSKEFKVRQRRSSLGKARTIMKQLVPQFECFVKGENPFE